VQELILSDNKLETLSPQTFAGLHQLKTLDLSANRLCELPVSIGTLPALRTLSIKQNRITHLQKELFLDEAFALQKLHAQHNALQDVPAELWEIDSLLVLNLMANRISHVPPEVSHLASLQVLNLCANRLASVPDEIGHLEALEELNLSFNQLTALPATIGQLYSLQRFYVGYNQLSTLPEMTDCEALWEYFVTGNAQVESLPSSLWAIPTISKIYASGMKLSEIPKTILELRDLEVLDVAYNEISELPEELAELQLFRRLNASHNRLRSLVSLRPCYDLQNLDLSYNAFEESPDEEFRMLLERDVEILFDGNPATPAEDVRARVVHLHPSERFTQVGLADMIGKRPTMEDALALQGTLDGHEDWDFYGLYDGHAGREAATFSGEHVHRVMLDLLKESKSSPLDALSESYPVVNQKFREFLYSDEFTGQSKYCGSTAVSVFLQGQKIYVVNVGDSRAVLCRGGKALRLSYDHKPYEDTEQDRIRGFGGCVMGETGRVNGLLAVSRSIGDFYMQPYVVDEPFRKEYDLESDDEFLILACDGVWDEVKDSIAVDLVRDEKNPFLASCKLRDYAYLLGSDDNISVIIVRFK